MPTTSNNTAQKAPTALSLVHSSSALTFASKKTNRLATAVHLITSGIPDAEPLRHAARTCSLRLFSNVSGLSAGTFSQDVVLKGVGVCAVEMDGLLEVLAHSGYVSHESADLLRGEYAKLVELLADKRVSSGGSAAFPSDLLDTPAETDNVLKEENKKVTVKDRNSKGHISPRGSYRTSSSVMSDKKPHERAGEREQVILALVRERGKVSVRDVADVVTDCSEKTLQRELLRLVGTGVLTKEGERRWSTYRLS